MGTDKGYVFRYGTASVSNLGKLIRALGKLSNIDQMEADQQEDGCKIERKSSHLGMMNSNEPIEKVLNSLGS